MSKRQRNKKKGAASQESISQSVSSATNGNVWNDYCSQTSVTGLKSDAAFVFAVWQTICALQRKNIGTSIGAVKGEMNSTHHCFMKSFDDSLKKACNDNLILKQTVDNVSILSLPDNDGSGLDFDFHCYQCFRSGVDLLKCESCDRVYHDDCYHYSDAIGKCYYCKPFVQEEIRGRKLNKKDINDLLSILYYKLGLPNGYLNVLHSTCVYEEYEQLEGLIRKLLFRYDFTNKTIQRKLENNEYSTILDCTRDYRQLVFNVCVIFGSNSEMGKKAQAMYSYIQSEYMYMHNCFDCYVSFARNKEGDKRNIWFLLPCNPPHEIVFAKGDTFPYFPAKVIKSEKDQSYLWFFGDHEVSWVHKLNMTPTLPLKEPITHKMKLALIEMEKYKLIVSRYKNGKVNFSGIPRIKAKNEDESE